LGGEDTTGCRELLILGHPQRPELGGVRADGVVLDAFLRSGPDGDESLYRVKM
jgi:hypothetical protein